MRDNRFPILTAFVIVSDGKCNATHSVRNFCSEKRPRSSLCLLISFRRTGDSSVERIGLNRSFMRFLNFETMIVPFRLYDYRFLSMFLSAAKESLIIL